MSQGDGADGLGVRLINAEAEFKIARYTFSIGLDAWFFSITNNSGVGEDAPIGSDVVTFQNPNPHNQSVDGNLYKWMDDARISFIDPTGTLLNDASLSLEGVNLALFPVKRWRWDGLLYNPDAPTDGTADDLMFEDGGAGGVIDHMVLVGPRNSVPDAGSTLGFLAFAFVGLGFLKRHLN